MLSGASSNCSAFFPSERCLNFESSWSTIPWLCDRRSTVLSNDAELEIAGSAPNGRIALAKIPQADPDLVTVDIEMPEIDGLQTLAAIRQSYPRLPVIVFSSLAERGAAATIDALLLTANGYVMKPTDVASLASGVDRFHQKLISKTKVYCSTPGGIRGAACPSRLSKRLS